MRNAAIDRLEGALSGYERALEAMPDLPAEAGAELRGKIAETLVDMGLTLGALDRSADAIAVYDELLHALVTRPSRRCASRSPARCSTRA